MSDRDEVFRRFDVRQPLRPAYVVWELTLRCDHACTHCGSRATEPRPNELSTVEALVVVEQLRELGCFECVLIGGEAYLHEGFLEIVRALRRAGVRPSMTTGARGITRELATQLAEAGLHTVSVSIDGLEATHDLMRAARGSFTQAVAALGWLREAGLRTASNINLNRLNQRDLEPLYEVLREKGIGAWQVQLTAPLGRAADRPAMLLQPWDLLDLVPRVAALKKRAWNEARISLQPGNNLGYFGPEEGSLRSPAGAVDHFQGCQAGRQLAGIEADGVVKGCPSLPREYAGGSLREKPLRDLWAHSEPLAFTRHRTVDSLWGFCRTCPYAETCMGGCSFTAHALMGRPGNNPYCHFRARTLAQRGVRERLVLRKAAAGDPFDCGQFAVVEEPAGAPDPRPPLPSQLLKKQTTVPPLHDAAVCGVDGLPNSSMPK